MQTIVLATQKGGSGKSTLAISLALAAIRAGHTVRLIETDSQGTAFELAAPPPLCRRRSSSRSTQPGEVEQRLQSLGRDGVTLTIVDTAAGVSAATVSAIRYADFCLIPTRPSIADIEATAATLSVIRAWHKPFAYVMNQTPIRSAARLASAENALGDEAALDAADIVARPLIVMRNDYQDALSAGLAVCEYAPGGKSAEEIRALWQWIDARLGNAVAASDEPIIEELVELPAILPAMGCAAPHSIRQRQLPESASPALNAQRAQAKAIQTTSPGWIASLRLPAQPVFPRHPPSFRERLAAVMGKLDVADKFGAGLLLDPA